MIRTLACVGAKLHQLGNDRSGAVAMIFGLGLLGLVLMTGFGIDYYRWSVARSETQSVVDGAALSAAASRKKTEKELEDVVDIHVAANEANMRKAFVNAATTTDVAYNAADDQQLAVNIRGDVNTLFMGLIGVQTMPLNVTGVAQRGEAEAVELVLVLDNTGSMNQVDSGGATRIAALKAAASDLIMKVKEREEADVKIGVVPYAEYVNVGVANRGQPWLSLDERDIYNPAKPGVGNYPDDLTYTVCVQRDPDYWVDEVRNLDGRSEIVRVKKTGACRKTETRPDSRAGKPKPGTAASTTRYRWMGCIYSRLGALRLTDVVGAPYVGMVVTNGQRDCQTEVVPLTASRSVALGAIAGMVTTKWDGADPKTYIPTGLIWGLNVLSPTAPFTQGRPYGADNRSPRKIMVLMTDGENTMRYERTGAEPFGRHAWTNAPGQIKQTNDDVTAICQYAKSLDIEIYTVALGVSDASATTMLRGCASDPSLFFNASNNAALGQAFADIAASINRVRLVR